MVLSAPNKSSMVFMMMGAISTALHLGNATHALLIQAPSTRLSAEAGGSVMKIKVSARYSNRKKPGRAIRCEGQARVCVKESIAMTARALVG